MFAEYAKSPVREAIFSVSFQTPLALEVLRQFCETMWSNQNYEPAEAESDIVEQPGPLGYVLRNSARSVLLRLTTTQMHYHRLGHYPGWKVASTAFLEAWQQLSNFIPEAISQDASIRYINQIGLEVPEQGELVIADYLNLLPKLPDNLPGVLGPFFLQLQTLDSELNLLGSITEATEFKDDGSQIDVVLDIRVSYSPPEQNLAPVSLVDFMPAGRKFKNQLFESCITPATRALFA